MAGNGIFGTAINCMDGRTQEPVIQFMKKHYGVDYVDMITEPGPIKALAENENIGTLDSIKRRLRISTDNHGSRVVAVVGHFGCAGNPVEKETQVTQLHASVKTLGSWGFNVNIIKLWVDDAWQVHLIA